MSDFDWPTAGGPVELRDATVTLHRLSGADWPGLTRSGLCVGRERVWARVCVKHSPGALWLRAGRPTLAWIVERSVRGCGAWHDVPLAIEADAWAAEPAEAEQ